MKRVPKRTFPETTLDLQVRLSNNAPEEVRTTFLDFARVALLTSGFVNWREKANKNGSKHVHVTGRRADLKGKKIRLQYRDPKGRKKKSAGVANESGVINLKADVKKGTEVRLQRQKGDRWVDISTYIADP